MVDRWILCGVAVVLLLLSALCSGSEMSFFSLTHNDIGKLRRGRSRHGKLVLHLLEQSDLLLAALLIANNLVNICIVILSSEVIDLFFTITRFEFLIKTVLVTFVLLLFGEIMPKIAVQAHPIRFAAFAAPFVRVIRTLFYPMAWLLLRAGSGIGKHAPGKNDLSIDDLADAMDMTRAASKEEQGMLSGIVNFVNTEVVEIMHPRVDMTAISNSDSYDEVKRVIIASGYSRIPVYEGDLDNIQGTLYVKDLLPHINEGDDFTWQRFVRKAYFVPEHKKINDLLAEFQSQKIHIAVVVDEYGSTQGLVSLEDIIEEVVGEISDESDVHEKFYTRLDKNTYLFDGKTHLGDFERVLELEEDTFADVQGRAETLAGLMLELKRDFLRKGEMVRSHGIRFVAEGVEGRRIDKVKVTLHG